MSTVGNLTVESKFDHENGGAASDFYRSDDEETAESTLERKFGRVGKNDSLKSTRSLSVFRDQNATKAMARSEEMTYDIYQDIDVESDVIAGKGNAKIGAGQSIYKKSGNKSSGDGTRSRGAFQMKQSGSNTSLSSISSPSLHDEKFKASLANSLSRRASSESISQQNGNSLLISMDPSGKGTGDGTLSSASTGSRQIGGKGQWNALSKASSITSLTSTDGVGVSGNEAMDSETDARARQAAGYASDVSGSTREVVSYSVSRYSPAEVDTSNSLVRDRNFRAKMAALFSGHTSSASNSAPSSIARNNYARDVEAESRDSTLSRDLHDVATPIDSQPSTLEGRTSGGDARSVRSATPSDLRDVITTGNVSKMAKQLAIRGFGLTGRPTDSSSAASSLERPGTSRAGDRSEEGRTETRKFKFQVDGKTTESEETTTARSEDDLGGKGRDRHQQQQQMVMKMDLLRDLRRRNDEDSSQDSEEIGSRYEANCSQEEMTFGNRNSQFIEAQGLSLTRVERSEGHLDDANDDESKSMTTTTERDSVQPETEDVVDRRDSSSTSKTRSGFGASQATGNDVRDATSVSVEITDGSETGQSYIQDENSSLKSEKDSHFDAAQSIGPHALTLRMTSDDEDVTSRDGNGAPTFEEESDEGDDERLGSTSAISDPIQRTEYSNDETTDGNKVRVPNISRRSNYDKIRRTTEKFPDGEGKNGQSRTDGATAKRDIDDVIRRTHFTDLYESPKTGQNGGGGGDHVGDHVGDHMGDRSRRNIAGRPKITHTMSKDSSTTGSFLSQDGDSFRRTTDPESAGSSFDRSRRHPTTEQPRRNVVITGRDNIRRIAPSSAWDSSDSIQNDDGRTGVEEMTHGSKGQPRSTQGGNYVGDGSEADVSPRSSLSLDPRTTNETGAHISFSSDESQDRTSVRSRPNDPEIGSRRTGNGGGLIIKLSPESDDEVTTRRPLTPGSDVDSERIERPGIHDESRRRARQRKLSRQFTDSSLTDQENYEDAEHRPSGMRRRLKRTGSRQSVDGETEDPETDDPGVEDPGALGEPDYIHRESYSSRRTTIPVTGLISSPRSQSRPDLSSDDGRAPVGLLEPRPSSVTFSERRAVTPVTGRISVTQHANPKTGYVGTTTPVTGLISVPAQPDSTVGLVTSTHSSTTHDVTRHSSASPTGSSYLRSVNVLDPENPELIAIDPELRDAQKTGNIYHITMSIRPITSASRAGSVIQSFEVVDTDVRTVPWQAQSVVSSGPRTSWVLTEEDVGPSSSGLTSALGLAHRPAATGAASQNDVGFHLELHGGEQIKVLREGGAHPRRMSPLLSVQSETGEDTPEVMTDFGRTVDFAKADEYSDEINSPTRKKNREKLPEIRRGNILIKNRIDTSRPQIIDVITTDDDVDGDVDDNSNMFHTNYLSRKENPLYASNPDLSKWDDEDIETSSGSDDVTQDFGGQRSPNRARGAVARAARSKRSSSSDPITRTSRTNSISAGYDESEGQFDIEIPVNQRKAGRRSEQRDGFAGPSVGSSQRNDSSFGGKFGGKFDGYSGESSLSVATVTRSDAKDGSVDVSQEFDDPFKNDIFDTEVKVNKDYYFGWKERSSGGGHGSKFKSSSSRQTRSGQTGSYEPLFTSGSNGQLNEQTISTLNIRSLMVGTSSSVKQTIKVDRLDDEILSELPADELRQRRRAADSDPAAAVSVLDFDKVSEQVVMDVIDGKVVLTSTARSERIVPIMGADDLYKKMAVNVTKRIELDMTVTPQRRQLYEMIKQRNDGSDQDGPLDKKATFELYKKFAALADLDRAMAN